MTETDGELAGLVTPQLVPDVDWSQPTWCVEFYYAYHHSPHIVNANSPRDAVGKAVVIEKFRGSWPESAFRIEYSEVESPNAPEAEGNSSDHRAAPDH